MVAPASSRMRLILVTTLANCASNPSGRLPCGSKPGMPEMNSRSPVRAANDSGGALMPDGGGKCFIPAMVVLHLLSSGTPYAQTGLSGPGDWLDYARLIRSAWATGNATCKE